MIKRAKLTSDTWSQGARVYVPSATYDNTVSYQQGWDSISSANWAQSSNKTNSWMTQGRVTRTFHCNIEQDAIAKDWPYQLYRQCLFIRIDDDVKKNADWDSYLGNPDDIYGRNYKTHVDNQNAEPVKIYTVQQLNYLLATKANNYKDVEKILNEYKFIGVGITPEATMRAHSGEGPLATTVQLSGLVDIYNLWSDLTVDTNVYFLVKPIARETEPVRKFHLELNFHDATNIEIDSSQNYYFQLEPYTSLDGLDPSFKKVRLEVDDEIVYGSFYHAGKVDEILHSNTMLSDPTRDKDDNVIGDVVQLIRGPKALVLNLTARRNFPNIF